jgi:gluconolactonase
VITAEFEVFSRMPDALRLDRPSEWARSNLAGPSCGCFLEGPVFDEHGDLLVTDLEHGRVFRVDPAGGWTPVADYDGEPNGMAPAGPGELIVADYRHGLLRLDVASGTVTPHLTRRQTERFKGVNDLVFDRAGNLYFTDQGQTGLHDPTGRVYRLGVDGRLDPLLWTVPSPNGLVLSPDERFLFVAATRDNAVWQARLTGDGNVTKVGRYFAMNGPAGPDGLAMDVEGRLVVANAGRGVVWVLDRYAEPVLALRSPVGDLVTNVAYGGPDRTTLYCTEASSGTVLAAELDVPGCPVFL